MCMEEKFQSLSIAHNLENITGLLNDNEMQDAPDIMDFFNKNISIFIKMVFFPITVVSFVG
jgi:hypothetical protein